MSVGISTNTLSVAEILESIQGESTWAGLPFVFVRLAGCSVGCGYCDTEYAHAGGTRMSIGNIVTRCRSLGRSLVEITGGEPLEQQHCAELATALLDARFTVLCETSGTYPISRLPVRVIKIMDIKCPGSGVADRNDWSNIDALSRKDEVKFVISDRPDYEWSREIVNRYKLIERCHAVLFAPVFGRLEPAALAQWILADALPVRLQLQLHKYIWPAGTRGV